MTTPTPKPGDRVIAIVDDNDQENITGVLQGTAEAPVVIGPDGEAVPVLRDPITPFPVKLKSLFESQPAPAPAAGTRCCIGPFADGRHALNCPERCQDCGGDPDGPAACLARLRDLYETEQRLRRKADSELVKLKNLTGLDPAKWVPDEIPAAGGSDTDDGVRQKIRGILEGAYRGVDWDDMRHNAAVEGVMAVVAPELARLRTELSVTERARREWQAFGQAAADGAAKRVVERDEARQENERLRGEQDVRAAVERVLDGALGDTLTPETGHGLASDVAVVVQQRDQARAELARCEHGWTAADRSSMEVCEKLVRTMDERDLLLWLHAERLHFYQSGNLPHLYEVWPDDEPGDCVDECPACTFEAVVAERDNVDRLFKHLCTERDEARAQLARSEAYLNATRRELAAERARTAPFARQLADVRDDLATMTRDRDEQRERCGEVANDRDALSLELDEALEQVPCGNPNQPCGRLGGTARCGGCTDDEEGART